MKIVVKLLLKLAIYGLLVIQSQHIIPYFSSLKFNEQVYFEKPCLKNVFMLHL